jgi:S-adenosylmethionine:tRNA ribosyltransferase-isomerase
VRVSEFHFDLPEELIAQHPPAVRGSSRMLALDRVTAGLTDARFRDLPEFLRAGDLLVLNDSRVLPARLYALRSGARTQAGSPEPTGLTEVLLIEHVEDAVDANPTSQNRDVGHPIVWRALVKPAKKVRVGEALRFVGAGGDGPGLTAEVVAAGEYGERTLRFAPVEDFYGTLERIGHMPLPPYIRREQAAGPDSAEDRQRYQTVFAQRPGSAAAPTAGLHFTPEMLAALRARGVEIAYITLHVGLGTFQPVRVSEVEDIRLHSERYTLPAETAEALNRALAQGRRVIAVGTTTIRALEHIAASVAGPGVGPEQSVPQGLKPHPDRQLFGTGEPVPLSRARGEPARFEAHSGSTSIFIGPGHRFRVVSGLLTNFHLPESTLLMLVSAFAAPEGEPDRGRETVLAAYGHAVREGYRFYSYGDCMLVV